MVTDWYSVIIYDNPITRKNIVFQGDTRKIYEITFKNGTKDLIKILSQDLYINVKSILKTKFGGGYKLEEEDFIDMLKNNRIKETEYVIEK